MTVAVEQTKTEDTWHPKKDTQTPRTQDVRYRPYQPFGSALKLFYDKSDEVLICGPAGTGKSRAALEKLHLCASKYKGMRGLIVRKTRASITQSAMVTYEKFVIPENGTVRFRTAEQEYRYANGSVIVVGGMDKASKVLSSEYDMIYIQQAEEFGEEDWETLLTRNRYGVMPYAQLIGDCNPSFPKHWLKQRADRKELTHIKSIHEDNPVLYNQVEKRWTKRGKAYMGRLNKLTGVRRKRLLKGIWAAAEGQIYLEWSDDIHLIDRFPIPKSWIRFWVVDFGYVDPFVWQAWAFDEDTDKAYMFAEIYQTGLLPEDVAKKVIDWRRATQELLPDEFVADHDGAGRATLERYLDLEVTPAEKSILEGIETVKSRLRIQDDNKPGLYILRDSLLEPDPVLMDNMKPLCTAEEIEAYEWSDTKQREKPKDEYNHGMDCVRYLCKHLDGEYGGWAIGPVRH